MLSHLKNISIHPSKFYVFSLGFIFSLFANFQIRSFHYLSGPGWLDPWVNIGYAQTFPKTSFSWHYYKESRIFTILWDLLSVRTPIGEWLFPLTNSVFGGTATYLAWRFSRNILTSLIFTCMISMSPYLWGDWAGGGDYYNTLGNLLISLLLISYFYKDSSRKYKAIGFLLTLVLLEVPSGILVFTIVVLALILKTLLSEFKDDSRNTVTTIFSKTLSILGLMIKGGLYLIVFEVFLLLVFLQNPRRLLTGPKFLIASVFDAQVQQSWWQKIDFLDLNSRPPLKLLIVVNLILIVLMFLRMKVSTPIFSLQIGFISVSLFLIILQISGRTIALSTSYFTTPIVVLGILLVSISLSNTSFLAQLFSVGGILAGFVLDIHVSQLPYLLLLFTLFIFSLLFQFLKLPKLAKQSVLAPLFLSIGFLLGSDSGVNIMKNSIERAQFKTCEDVRSEQRDNILSTAAALDALGVRGSLFLNADANIFGKTIQSTCIEFQGTLLTNFLMSLSQLGFPGASIYGPIQGKTVDDYHYASLAEIENRIIKPHSCFLFVSLKSTPSSIRAQYLGTSLYLQKKCPV